MCQKVKDELLDPYAKKGIISLTVCRIGISSMLPPELSPDMYNYNFLHSETGKAITPTIMITGNEEIIFLQKMTFETFSRAFEQSLREVMSNA